MAALSHFKVTLFYLDSFNDKILIGSVEELKETLRMNEKLKVAKIMAKVVPIDPIENPTSVNRASSESGTQTNLDVGQDSGPPPASPHPNQATPPLQNLVEAMESQDPPSFQFARQPKLLLVLLRKPRPVSPRPFLLRPLVRNLRSLLLPLPRNRRLRSERPRITLLLLLQKPLLLKRLRMNWSL
jgi:hypothetical protein